MLSTRNLSAKLVGAISRLRKVLADTLPARDTALSVHADQMKLWISGISTTVSPAQIRVILAALSKLEKRTNTSFSVGYSAFHSDVGCL